MENEKMRQISFCIRIFSYFDTSIYYFLAMSFHSRLCTEHSGAKQRRGYWGYKAEAKSKCRGICRKTMCGAEPS
jgi:hypothetical protein